jgi:hypothetical protein
VEARFELMSLKDANGREIPKENWDKYVYFSNMSIKLRE